MQNVAYKAVFSDIDGTLLTSQHRISPKTQEAIQRLVQHGIPFIPVSARPPFAITPYTQQLGTQNAIICYSGALILDADLQPIYSVSIEKSDLEILESCLQQYLPLSISHYSGTDWFCNEVNNRWIQQESEITGLQAVKKTEKLANVHKILVMGEPDEILALEAVLNALLPHLSIHRSKNEYLEITNPHATKSNAIRFMEKVLGVTSEQVVAFGDNFNDLDMLQYAGLSVAMGNAPEEVKAAAKRVTTSNDEDGIALVLNELF